MRRFGQLKEPFSIWLWILALALLAVGARNFEEGFMLDSPLYADIARNIVRNHSWVHLESSVPDFRPFFEHPHLNFWLMAIVFKLLPIADWSARIPGHLYYVFFLGLFYFYLRWSSSEKTATAAVLLLWTWYRFSNPFSACFTDTGALFWGAAGVFSLDVCMEKGRPFFAVCSGLAFTLCLMSKGVVVAGFFPAAGVLALLVARDRSRWKVVLKSLGICMASFGLGVFLYFIVIRASEIPDFFQLYWKRQMANRFMHIWTLRNLGYGAFWSRLLSGSNSLAPLALLSLGRSLEGRRFLVPATLLLTFIFLYAPNGMAGIQYWLMIYPWLAWLIADGLFARLKWNPEKVRKISFRIAIGVVLLLQYLPFRTHAWPLTDDEHQLARLRQALHLTRLWQDSYPYGIDFFQSDRYAWYGDIRVEYVKNADPLPPADDRSIFINYFPESFAYREKALGEKGWCLEGHFASRTFWLKCPTDKSSFPY